MHALRMLRRRAHPIYGLPSDLPVNNRLREEFAALSLRRRCSQWSKVVRRELLIIGTGQARWCVEQAPPATRRLLWLYTWDTIGDAVMDLACRASLPPWIEVDLCIAEPLTELFATDFRFRQVHARLESCAAHYDFVLLHELSTRPLLEVRQRFPQTPFASMLGYATGEHFDRVALAGTRLVCDHRSVTAASSRLQTASAFRRAEFRSTGARRDSGGVHRRACGQLQRQRRSQPST